MLSSVKSLVILSLLWSTGIATLHSADDRAVTFYVQLIRGSGADRPENPKWKEVGPKLGKNLHAVFRWKNYWEVRRRQVVLAKGQSSRFHLAPEREVEIKSLEPPYTQIRLYHKGRLTCCCRQPVGEHMAIFGGDGDANEAWFVIVRRGAAREPD